MKNQLNNSPQLKLFAKTLTQQYNNTGQKIHKTVVDTVLRSPNNGSGCTKAQSTKYNAVFKNA
jgi:hypothetical protein